MLTRLRIASSLHELKVIHDEKIKPFLCLEPAGFAAHLLDGNAARVVDIDRCLFQSAGCLRQSPPILFLKFSRPQRMGIDARFRTKHAEDNLRLGHFQTENSHHRIGVNGCMRRKPQSEAGLPHARSPRHHHQVRSLKPCGNIIEVVVPRGNSRDMFLSFREFIDDIETFLDNLTDRAERPFQFALCNAEDRSLGKIEQVID